MRFMCKKHIKGEIRTVKKFLFFPKKIGDEIRWLERASIRQKFTKNYREDKYWKDEKWEN